MQTIEKVDFKTPYGELIIASFQDKLCLCDWKYRNMRTQIDNRIKTGLKAEFEEKESEVIIETKKQLQEYFDNLRQDFKIPLLLVGTEFQKKVWESLMQIPYGTTISYLKLSEKLQNTKAIRAIASANGANAISIIVPCHRVIGSTGELVGYAGGLNVKKKLLDIEMKDKFNQLNLF